MADAQPLTPDASWGDPAPVQPDASWGEPEPVQTQAMTPDASWGEPEPVSPDDTDTPSPVGTLLRRAAIQAPAGVGGAAAGAAGAAIGGAIGNLPGAIIGGIGGFMGGAELATKGEDWFLDKLGLRDGTGFFSRAQEQADVENNPKSAFVGDLMGQIAPGAGFGAPVEASASLLKKLAPRIIGGGAQAGFEAGSEYANDGSVDPFKVGAAGVAGAAFAKPRAWTEKFKSNIGGLNAGAAGEGVEETDVVPPNPAAVQSVGVAATPDPVGKKPVGQQPTEEGQNTSAGSVPIAKGGTLEYQKGAAGQATSEDARFTAESTQEVIRGDKLADPTLRAAMAADEEPIGTGNWQDALQQQHEPLKPPDPVPQIEPARNPQEPFGAGNWQEGMRQQYEQPKPPVPSAPEVTAPVTAPPATQQAVKAGRTRQAGRLTIPPKQPPATQQAIEAAQPQKVPPLKLPKDIPEGDHAIVQNAILQARQAPDIGAEQKLNIPSIGNSFIDEKGTLTPLVDHSVPPLYRRPVMIHEMVEATLRKLHGDDYDDGHAIATHAEMAELDRLGFTPEQKQQYIDWFKTNGPGIAEKPSSVDPAKMIADWVKDPDMLSHHHDKNPPADTTGLTDIVAQAQEKAADVGHSEVASQLAKLQEQNPAAAKTVAKRYLSEEELAKLQSVKTLPPPKGTTTSRRIDPNSPEGKEIAARLGATVKPAADVTVEPQPTREAMNRNTLKNALNNSTASIQNLMNKIAANVGVHPNSPTSPIKAPHVQNIIDAAPSWFKKYSNAVEEGKLLLARMSGKYEEDLKAGKFTLADSAKVYDAIENRGVAGLNAKEKGIYDDHIKPMKDLVEKLATQYDLLRQQGGFPGKPDPILPGVTKDFISRQRTGTDLDDKGKVDVVAGRNMSGLSPAAMGRENFGAEPVVPGSSPRLVFNKEDGQIVVMRNGGRQPVKMDTKDLKVRDTITIPIKGKDVDFQVDHATRAEITKESGTDKNGRPNVNYETDPILPLTTRAAQLFNSIETVKLVMKVKDDPSFKSMTVKNKEDIPKGETWTKTSLDQFKGYYMPKQLAWLFDDLDTHPQGMLGRAGSELVHLFMIPGFPLHDLNVLTQGIISRGFKWITPKAYQDLGQTIMSAKQATDHFNDDYIRALRAGASPMFGAHVASDLLPGLQRRLGVDQLQNPSKWDPVAKALGVSSKDLYRGVQNATSKKMWQINSYIYMQSFLENERANLSLGMSPEKAANEAVATTEKLIPSYGTPTTMGSSVFGETAGRAIQQALLNPAVALFSRYHYNLLQGFANLSKDLVKGTPAQRTEAAGQIIVAAAMGALVFPALSNMAKSVTGNQGAEVNPRGMLALTDAVQKAATGDKDYTRLLSQFFTPSIPLNMAAQASMNRDWTGRPIVEVNDLTNPKNLAKAVGQGANWAAGQAVSPLGTFSSGVEAKGGNAGDAAGRMGAGFLGVHLPSKGAQQYEKMQKIKNAQAAMARQQHPRGIIEDFVNRAVGR